MRKSPKQGKATRQLAKQRTERQLERYHFQKALMEAWENDATESGIHYYQELKRKVHRLHQQLIVKGAL